MYEICPSQIELYHMRILLLHVPGATTHDFLKTVNDIKYPGVFITFDLFNLFPRSFLNDNWWKVMLPKNKIFENLNSCQIQKKCF